LENVFEGVHGAGELGGIVGDGSGAAIRIADQACTPLGMYTRASRIFSPIALSKLTRRSLVVRHITST
jgi:hypothetical protein